MVVQTGPGIDHGHVNVPGHHVGSSGVGMANHDDISAQSAHSVAGVEQRFAFFNARSGGLDEHGVRSQQFGRDFKRTASTGGSFVKKQNHALALQQRARLVRVHAASEFQDFKDLRRVGMLDSEQG